MSDMALHADIVEYNNTFVVEGLEMPVIIEGNTLAKAITLIKVGMKCYIDTFGINAIKERKSLSEPVNGFKSRYLLTTSISEINKECKVEGSKIKWVPT